MATVWKVTGLRVVRYTDSSVIAWWQFQTGTTTAHFSVYWEEWDRIHGTWVPAGNSNVGTDQYTTSGGKWFYAQHSTNSSTNVSKVRVWVDPVPKSGSSWKHAGTYSAWAFTPQFDDAVGEAMDPREVEVSWDEGGTGVVVEWGDPDAMWDRVSVYRSVDGGDMSLLKRVGTAGPYVDRSLSAGHTYRYAVQARLSGSEECERSAPSEAMRTRPATPTGLKAKAVGPTSVRLDWQDSGTTGDGWRVEWSADADAWDNHADVSTDDHEGTPGPDGRSWRTVDVGEAGAETWFRLRRTLSGAPEAQSISGWATAGKATKVRCVAGTVPAAPTLGATPASVPADGTLVVTWTHNSEDGSDQSAFELQAAATSSMSGATAYTGTTDSSATLSPASLGVGDGGAVWWRVRTKGALDEWSPWSASASVTVWAAPVAGVTVAAAVDSLPFIVSLDVGATSAGNRPTLMWLGVYATEGYRTVGPDGTEERVAAGECLWSTEAAPGERGCSASGWSVSLAASDVRLEGGQTYEARGGCVTAQGMTCEAVPATFIAELGGDVTGCDADVEVDHDGLFATVSPRCTDGPDGELREGVTLSVWRVGADGTELVADGLPNDGAATCVDLHPPFVRATYRVVATDATTGAPGSADVSIEWPAPGLVIQWGESLVAGEDGSLSLDARRLVLPYDVEISRKWSKESSLNEWQGRRYPVSRYETQRGDEATWSCVLDRRELALWEAVEELATLMEDVHVRDTMGGSYTAHVQVSRLDAKYGSGKSSVTLAVTRVEGE